MDKIQLCGLDVIPTGATPPIMHSRMLPQENVTPKKKTFQVKSFYKMSSWWFESIYIIAPTCSLLHS